MRVAYSYQQQELLQKLLAAAPPSGSGSVEQESAGPSLCRPVSCSLAATAAVLDAVVHLQSSPGVWRHCGIGKFSCMPGQCMHCTCTALQLRQTCRVRFTYACVRLLFF